VRTPTPEEPAPDEQATDESVEDEVAEDHPTPDDVDPMAPGRTLVDPDLGEAVEPNEPA
jgi:hypothetical protein